MQRFALTLEPHVRLPSHALCVHILMAGGCVRLSYGYSLLCNSTSTSAMGSCAPPPTTAHVLSRAAGSMRSDLPVAVASAPMHVPLPLPTALALSVAQRADACRRSEDARRLDARCLDAHCLDARRSGRALAAWTLLHDQIVVIAHLMELIHNTEPYRTHS